MGLQGLGFSAGLGCEGLGVGFRANGISGFSGRGWLGGLGSKLSEGGVRRGSCTATAHLALHCTPASIVPIP